MAPHHILTWIVIGLCAGYLAARLVEGKGLGCVMNTLVGIAGAVIGGVLVDHFGPDSSYGFLGSIVVAFIGACVFLGVLRVFGVRPKRTLGTRRRW